MYVLSVSQRHRNVNTYEKIFVGAILLRQKGEKFGLSDSKRNSRTERLF